MVGAGVLLVFALQIANRIVPSRMFKSNVLLHLGKQHLCCVTQYREIKCIVFDAEHCMNCQHQGPGEML